MARQQSGIANNPPARSAIDFWRVGRERDDLRQRAVQVARGAGLADGEIHAILDRIEETRPLPGGDGRCLDDLQRLPSYADIVRCFAAACGQLEAKQVVDLFQREPIESVVERIAIGDFLLCPDAPIFDLDELEARTKIVTMEFRAARREIVSQGCVGRYSSRFAWLAQRIDLRFFTRLSSRAVAVPSAGGGHIWLVPWAPQPDAAGQVRWPWGIEVLGRPPPYLELDCSWPVPRGWFEQPKSRAELSLGCNRRSSVARGIPSVDQRRIEARIEAAGGHVPPEDPMRSYQARLGILRALLEAAQTRNPTSLWSEAVGWIERWFPVPSGVTAALQLGGVELDLRIGSRMNADGEVAIPVHVLSAAIEAVGHFERELNHRTFADARTVLGELLRDDRHGARVPDVRSFFEAVRHGVAPRLEQAIAIVREHHADHQTFWASFRARAKRDIGEWSPTRQKDDEEGDGKEVETAAMLGPPVVGPFFHLFFEADRVLLDGEVMLGKRARRLIPVLDLLAQISVGVRCGALPSGGRGWRRGGQLCAELNQSDREIGSKQGEASRPRRPYTDAELHKCIERIRKAATKVADLRLPGPLGFTDLIETDPERKGYRLNPSRVRPYWAQPVATTVMRSAQLSGRRS